MQRFRDHIAIITLALFTLGSMLAAAYLLVSRQSQDLEQLGKARIEERALRAELELLKHFRPILGFMRLVQNWGIQGLAPVKDVDVAASRLSPLLNRIPNAVSFELVDEEGVHLHLVRVGEEWVAAAWPSLGSVSNSAGEPVAKGSVGSDSIQWQRLVDARGPFYRATIGWEFESHRWSAWLSVSQQGFESLATALDVGADTDFMWLGVGGRLIRLSEEVATGSNGISSSRVLEQVGRELRASEDGSPEWAFELASEDGRVFLGAVQQLEIEQDRVRYCVVSDRTVLLQDIQGPASTKIYVLLVLSGLGLVGLLVTGGRVLRQRRAAAQGQGYRHAEEEALLDLIQSGESERLEFKSTMRWNVRADRPGKEVELSWLTAVAAFLNSSGGTLLIGVDDDGNTTGIEADKFPNEDRFLLHFNNLVKEHIGLEFAGLIDFEIRTVTGSRIMVLDCRPSDQPVFLKKGNQEDFFIRVGPGSRKLSASEMLEFLKTR